MTRRAAVAVAPVVALLALWQGLSAAGMLNPLLYPPPSALAFYIAESVQSGDFQSHVAATLGRLAAGFLLGCVTGIPLGSLLGASRTLCTVLEPLLSAVYAVPKVTLLPLFMLLLGANETARVLPVAATCFVVTCIAALDGARNVEPAYVEVARHYGARRWDVFRHIYFPSSLPHLFTGLRLALAYGLMVTIATEMVASETGIGSMVWLGWQVFSTRMIYAGLITAAVLGATVHALLGWGQRRWIPWKPEPRD